MGITDGEWECNLCGEYRTGCSLCDGDPNQKVIPVRNRISRAQILEDEHEIMLQTRAIRRAADARQGWS